MTLPAPLAPLVNLRQWVTYCLVANDKGKMDKLPCHWQTGHVSNAQEPGNWTTYDNALAHVSLAGRGQGAGVGFVLSAGDPYWFLDIDGCLLNDGSWSPLALDLRARLSAAACEVSQSGRGLHIIGRGVVPKHRCKNIPLGLELYTERRFIAITGTGANGFCDAEQTDAITSVVNQYFAPTAGANGPLDDWTSEPCEGWNGPVEDDELIRRARASKPKMTADQALRPGTASESLSFESLWTADVGAIASVFPDTGPYGKAYDASSADMSLATRLAFWTGRDCERIERLMRMSGLMRKKYERVDYIQTTIMKAAGQVSDVCRDKPAPPPPSATVSIDIPRADGTPRILSLGVGALDDKNSHLTIEFWLYTMGYRLSFDLFAERLLLNGEALTDQTERAAWLDLREVSQLKFPKELFGEAVRNIAWTNRFHPLQQWLDQVQSTWDGVPRLDGWLTTYLGVEPSPYAQAIGAIFLTAAVRRARQPGCKFDELMVLEGPQGIEKSTAVASLCPVRDWFSEDFTVSMDSKQLLEATHGKWLVEAPELSKLNSSEVEHVKHLLSRQFDRARMAYERSVTERGRQWVGFATVNADQYLSDPTGNRRFWPVKCGWVDIAGIERDRQQLWAEAAQREAAGAPIRLARDLWDVAAGEQASRVIVDPLMEALAEAVGHIENGKIRTVDLWTALGIPLDRRNSSGRRVGDVMRQLGWLRRRVKEDGKLSYAYFKGNEAADYHLDVTTRKFITERPALRVV